MVEVIGNLDAETNNTKVIDAMGDAITTYHQKLPITYYEAIDYQPVDTGHSIL